MESLSSYSTSIQVHGPLVLCSQQAEVLHLGPIPPSCGVWGLQPVGLPWDTLQEVVSPSGLLVLSQTPLVLVRIRIYFYKLVCGWLAASPCPHPLLPLPRKVSWLPSTSTIAQYHFSDKSCPGRQQGSSACTWCLARVPWAGPGGTFSSLLSAGRLAWFLGDLGPQETASYTFTFCLEPSIVPFTVISCFLTRKNRVFFLAYCSQSSE